MKLWEITKSMCLMAGLLPCSTLKKYISVEINLEVFNYITGTVVVQGEFTSPVMHGHHHRQQQLVTSY